MHQGCGKIAGLARTVEVVDAPAAPAGKHLATRTVAAAGPGDVVVIANQGRVNVSCWGDILTVAAQVNGIEGTVIDGACRDADAVAEAGYPLWARAAVPVTARGRIAERGSNVPVLFDGVLVHSGDLVLADGSGVVFLPADRAAEIIAAAERLTARQEAMAAAIRAGESVIDVMADAKFHAALTGDEVTTEDQALAALAVPVHGAKTAPAVVRPPTCCAPGPARLPGPCARPRRSSRRAPPPRPPGPRSSPRAARRAFPGCPDPARMSRTAAPPPRGRRA